MAPGAEQLTTESVKELITAALQDVNATVAKQATENEELQKKNEEAARVIVEQAKELAALKEKAKTVEATPVEYCKYGTDGRGTSNVWPRRDVENEPELNKPHHYDVSQDPNYLRCVGKFGSFRHEFRTLSALGSYISDFRREVEPSLAELRASDESTLKSEGRRLTNTLDGIVDLLSCRFSYIIEYIRLDANPHRLEQLWKKLYPREGTAAPNSSLDSWNKEFDKAQDTAATKLLAQLAAKADVSKGSGSGGGGRGGGGQDGASTGGEFKPKPRFVRK